MTTSFQELPLFQVVVSERDTQWLGTGTTRQKTARCIYFYAEKNEQGELFVQPLNGQDIPAGDKTLLCDADFCRRYKPEPLVRSEERRVGKEC